ncbi:TIGR02611 family protein [Nocardia mangyaensis]|uniref:TIGR02611 family protein n=1 Tax=Nocardia mangyaensis TaxID=2213200 RepID=A0A1J0VUT7_9NOCA|nr:TIGR02611 family protein [Nocardia mangyaensis]APE35824.1 TIGR02611 family protein [Nocardia mangyaensis]
MTSEPTADAVRADTGDPADSAGSPSRWTVLKERGRAFRAAIARRPTLNLGYRIIVGVVGGVVLLVGIITIPYPGPGWALVFAGFGILATEFVWAHHTLTWVRGKYRIVMDWYTSRGWVIRALGAVATFALVVVTLWLLGTYSMVAGWIGVDWSWLRSPLMS